MNSFRPTIMTKTHSRRLVILVLLIVPLLAATPTARAQGTQPQISALSNLGTRGFVQTGDNVLIGGLIVQGFEPRRVIIRALGPELTQYGVPNALANPTLELHNAGGLLIASNDNWQNTIIGGIITSDQRADIRNSGLAPGDRRESAIIADLSPGNYTAIVRGFNDTVGVALVEVYDLSPSPSPHQHRLRPAFLILSGHHAPADFDHPYLPLPQRRHLRRIVPNHSAIDSIGEQSGLQTHIETTENVSLCGRMKR